MDMARLSPHDLTACPQCDALYRRPRLAAGARARCSRCGALMFDERPGVILTTVSLALAALILLVVAISFPFLRIEAADLSSRASVFDAIAAFTGGSELMVPLSVAIAALIVLLPAARLCALVYALAPLLSGARPLPQATRMFRLAMRLRPWAMAEIFMIGVAVALVKLAGLAAVELGVAFWAFAAVVVLVAAKDMMLCERSVWMLLAPPRQAADPAA